MICWTSVVHHAYQAHIPLKSYHILWLHGSMVRFVSTLPMFFWYAGCGKQAGRCLYIVFGLLRWLLIYGFQIRCGLVIEENENVSVISNNHCHIWLSRSRCLVYQNIICVWLCVNDRQCRNAVSKTGQGRQQTSFCCRNLLENLLSLTTISFQV